MRSTEQKVKNSGTEKMVSSVTKRKHVSDKHSLANKSGTYGLSEQCSLTLAVSQ
jgi:hypothetical protein